MTKYTIKDKPAYDGRVNIWIKKEDRARWDAIKDKSEWIHAMLNMTPAVLSKLYSETLSRVAEEYMKK